jgi:hypothetical protein
MPVIARTSLIFNIASKPHSPRQLFSLLQQYSPVMEHYYEQALKQTQLHCSHQEPTRATFNLVSNEAKDDTPFKIPNTDD